MGDEQLRFLAQELVERVKQSVTIDWQVRENARAQVRVLVKRVKQQEVAEVVECLTGFKPTKIAVEAEPSRAPHLDELYASYREGNHVLSRSEHQQLGFRLAARFGLPRVFPIDHMSDMLLQAVLDYAEEHDRDFLEWFDRETAIMTAQGNEMQVNLSIRAILRRLNHPEHIAHDHSRYVRLAKVGAGDSYIGAASLSAWYDRNIRIFANLAAITESGDRAVVICGAGHAAILRELVHADQAMTLIEPLDYL